MKSVDELIEQYAWSTIKDESLRQQVAILVELSKSREPRALAFVNREISKWRYAPGHVFDVVEELLRRQEDESYGALSEYFGRRSEYERRWDHIGDGPDASEMSELNERARSRFDTLEKTFLGIEKYKQCRRKERQEREEAYRKSQEEREDKERERRQKEEEASRLWAEMSRRRKEGLCEFCGQLLGWGDRLRGRSAHQHCRDFSWS